MNDDARDFGPEQRHKHGDVQIVPIRHGGGKHVEHVARDKATTLIDALYEKGLLGEGRAAQRRHDAAMWFQETFRKTGLEPSVVGGYDPARSKDSGEMSDHAARALRDFQRAMSALGRERWAVYDLLLLDSLKRDCGHICRLLDDLAKHRGI